MSTGPGRTRKPPRDEAGNRPDDATVRRGQLQDDESSAMERERAAKLREKPSGGNVVFDENETAK